MDFPAYLAEFNKRIAIHQDRDREKREEAAAAKDAALAASAEYMRRLIGE